MGTRWWIACLVFGVLFGEAIGAESPGPAGGAPAAANQGKAPTSAKLESAIPERKLVFDHSEEEMPVLIPSTEMVGPRLAELAQQRYVAVVRLLFRTPESISGVRFSGLQHPKDTDRNWPRVDSVDPAGLASGTPKGLLPPAVLKMLTTDSSLHLRIQPYYSEPSLRRAGAEPQRWVARSMGLQITVMAPTADAARELVRGVLATYDRGYSLPIYETFVELNHYYQSKLVEAQAEVKAVGDKRAEARKQLEQLVPWKDITSETLANLTTQQRMLGVEEAGLKARIAAIEKIVADASKKGARHLAKFEQLDIAKTVAEIDLVALAAKRAAIEQLTEKGRKRVELSAAVGGPRGRSTMAEMRLDAVEPRAQAYAAAVAQKMPFAEVDGKIVIRRIRWEQPKPSAAASGSR